MAGNIHGGGALRIFSHLRWICIFHIASFWCSSAIGSNCPSCTAKERIVPDIVIPFFERDLCKLKITASSLSMRDPAGHLGNVYLMWVSEHPAADYEKQLDDLMDVIGQSRQVQLIDFSSVMKGYLLDGWHAQQLLKLKIAYMVTSEYYMVMDAKNTLIADVQADTFFTSCNQAKIAAQYLFAKLPEPHITWYKKAAKVQNATPSKAQYWPASITPILLHRQTVLSLLASIGEDPRPDALCGGPLCKLFGVGAVSGQGTTEFTMYNMFAYSNAKTPLECIHEIEVHNPKAGDQWALSLWRGVAENQKKVMHDNIETLRNITKGTIRPLMFGSQPSALDAMPKKQKEEAIEKMVEIYHGLYDPQKVSSTELIDCVVGKYHYGKNEKKFN